MCKCIHVICCWSSGLFGYVKSLRPSYFASVHYLVILNLGTICIRIAIFPLVILAQRNAAAMHNHLPTMQRLQEKMTLARMSGDVQEGLSQ